MKKTKRGGTKGDSISIAKKLAIMDEYNKLVESGCTKANQELVYIVSQSCA